MRLAKRIVYSPTGNLIFRSALRPFARMLPESVKIPVTGRIRIRLPEGHTMQLNVNPTCYAGKVLFWEGHSGFESDQFSIFVHLVKQSRVFLDIGANIGYYTVVAGLFNPDLEIVSFEPLPAACDFLRTNCRSNGLSNASPMQIAISDRTGDGSFFFSRNPKFDFVGRQLTSTGSLDRDQADLSPVLEKVEVQMMTLDDFLEMHPLSSVDLIKLDTEATEHLVLRGAQDTLSRYRPIIFCEVLPDRVEALIEEEFRALEYDMYRADGERLVQVDSLAHAADTTNDFVFCHPEKLGLIERFVD